MGSDLLRVLRGGGKRILSNRGVTNRLKYAETTI